MADLRVDNIVLSGYASAIACLDDSEKELGAVLIDMGGAICDMVVHTEIQFVIMIACKLDRLILLKIYRWLCTLL